jgi:predicted metalloprotease
MLTGARAVSRARCQAFAVARWAVLLIVGLSLAHTACSPDRGNDTGTGSGGDGTTEGTLEIPTEPQGSSGTPEDPLGEYSAAIENQRAREQKVLTDAAAVGSLLNDFWTSELNTLYPGTTFDPPDRFEYYSVAGNTPCGNDTQPKTNNAYYCFLDGNEHVAFDLNWLQQYLQDHPGGATTFLILAHEWGHAVQDAWLEHGDNDVWSAPARKELNADCLAGVFMRSSIDNRTIVEEVGDADTIFGWLYEGGTVPWTEPGDHGSAYERQTAFSDGYAQGTAYCRQNY